MSRCLVVAFTLAALFLHAFTARGENWPCWRGPRGDGTCLEPKAPVHWNGETGENVVWKAAVVGRGHSSPIVWDDRLFYVTCDEDSARRLLLCLNRADGRTIWQRTVLDAPLEKHHKLNSHASGTPATDGELVYVTFLDPDFASERETTPGNMVVAAYDFDGQCIWQVRPGRFSSTHGYCSSPLLFKDTVIVNGDHDGDSYIVALERKTGRTRWKVPRDNKTRSYCTPIIREIDGRTQMVFSGSKCVTSMDPNNGSVHWKIDGPTEQYVASLVYNGELFFMTAGFPEFHIQAIRPDGTGNVTDTHVVWHTTRGCSYVPSPIVEGDYFLVAKDTGIGSCFEASTGEHLWMERMSRHYSASLVSAGGLVYFLDDDGVMKVVRPGPELRIVAENPLGDYCYASPAISDGQMFLKGENTIFCIEEKSNERD